MRILSLKHQLLSILRIVHCTVEAATRGGFIESTVTISAVKAAPSSDFAGIPLQIAVLVILPWCLRWGISGSWGPAGERERDATYSNDLPKEKARRLCRVLHSRCV